MVMISYFLFYFPLIFLKYKTYVHLIIDFDGRISNTEINNIKRWYKEVVVLKEHLRLGRWWVGAQGGLKIVLWWLVIKWLLCLFFNSLLTFL